MNHLIRGLSDSESERLRGRILAVTTASYTGCFAVWTIFAIIGVEIQREYDLSDTEFGLLVGIPFLSGSVMRVVLGVLADRYGGRRLFIGVMILAAIATWFVADAATFPMLLVAALGSGIAGGLLGRRNIIHRAMVSERAARHGAWYIRRGQCGLGHHQAGCAVGYDRLELAGRRQTMGDATSGRSRNFLARLD